MAIPGRHPKSSTDPIAETGAGKVGSSPRPGKARPPIFAVAIGVLLLLLILRLALPSIVVRYVNSVLDGTDGVVGSIDDVDIAIYRGAYQIYGIVLQATASEAELPIFTADTLDLSVHWAPLFRGEVAGEIIIESPTVNIVAGPTQEKTQTGTQVHWTEGLNDLVPININRFKVKNGTLNFSDPHAEPKVEVEVTDLQIEASNLSTVRKEGQELPSSATASATVFGSGQIEAEVKLDPLAKLPHFTLNVRLQELEATALNELLEAYASIDAESGQVAVYSEMEVHNGEFTGYVKPLIRSLEVGEQDSGGILAHAWEAIAGAAIELLQADGTPGEQVAAKIPVQGRYTNPDLGIWEAIETLLGNAWWQALRPGLEGLSGIHVEVETDG